MIDEDTKDLLEIAVELIAISEAIIKVVSGAKKQVKKIKKRSRRSKDSNQKNKRKR